MPAPVDPPDPLATIPPPDVLRRLLADLTRRRTLVQAILRVSVRIANYPSADAPPGPPAPSVTSH